MANSELADPRIFSGLTYQGTDITINLVPIIVILFLLYFIRIFSLMGGTMDDFLSGIATPDYNPGVLDDTYDPSASTQGGFNLFGAFGGNSQNLFNGNQNGYNAPQASNGYSAPQANYNAPNQQQQSPNGYNAPQQTGYNAPQPQQPVYNSGTGNRVDFNIPVENQAETFDPTLIRLRSQQVQNEADELGLTPEEVALYGHLLFPNRYLYLEKSRRGYYRRKRAL